MGFCGEAHHIVPLPEDIAVRLGALYLRALAIGYTPTTSEEVRKIIAECGILAAFPIFNPLDPHGPLLDPRPIASTQFTRLCVPCRGRGYTAPVGETLPVCLACHGSGFKVIVD